ncbi:MAG: hypothetical protein ACE37B_06420 [Ilumatobacter sp.]|jgi:hypothetical protein|uniref:hypothetical protein n=1 Tax=Ilumatobacter sp. TaxID=1967498 RepID=UPI00391A188C
MMNPLRPSTPRHIVISGGPASGKSTIGVHLAHLVHRPFLDLDEDEGNNGPERLSRLLAARHPTVITTYPESFETLARGHRRGQHPEVALVWLAHQPGTRQASRPPETVDVVIAADATVPESVDVIVESFGLGPA